MEAGIIENPFSMPGTSRFNPIYIDPNRIQSDPIMNRPNYLREMGRILDRIFNFANNGAGVELPRTPREDTGL